MNPSRLALIISLSSLILVSAIASDAIAQNGNEVRIAQISNTQTVAEIDRIAQQITVLINSTQNGNGSGVIVAKDGNTYYVLTAAHVVAKQDRYQIITPDDKQYDIEYETVKIFKGVDLALLKFVSSESYRSHL